MPEPLRKQHFKLSKKLAMQKKPQQPPPITVHITNSPGAVITLAGTELNTPTVSLQPVSAPAPAKASFGGWGFLSGIASFALKNWNTVQGWFL